MRASSFLSVIIISLTWHTLQVSHPYQPRLFSPALGILSTCVRLLSLTSKCYARGRASPSPTDGYSPAVQLPLSLSSSCHHHRHPAAIVVVVQLPSSSSSSHHCHCPSLSGPCRLARIRGTRCPVSWTCMVSRDTIPRWWMPRIARIVLPQVVQQDHLPFYLLQVSIHARQGCSYQPGISLTLALPSSRQC
jgi:hypothetical protein